MDSGQPEVSVRKVRRTWLTAVAKITLHNQSHWWVIPVSLLFFGAVTAVHLAPYQAQSSGYGDGSLILFGSANLRYYIINPIYLFIVANVGGHQRYDDLVLHRLGTRARLWLGKAAVFAALTLVYWLAVILFVEVAALPFANGLAPGWSGKLLAFYGGQFVAESSSHAAVWASTVWFVLLSWLGLGGVAFIVGQMTRQAGLGFIVGMALNLSGFLAEGLTPIFGLFAIVDIRGPMLFVWSGYPLLSFGGATAYWGVWYLALVAVVAWQVDQAGAMLRSILRSWLHGVWLIVRMSLGWLWLLVALLGLVSVWIEREMLIGSELDSLHLMMVPLAPIVSLGGPTLDAPLFSLIFLRWLLIFLLFLFLLGETAVSVLWWQHVMFLPRLGSRSRWWFGNVTAVAGLALLYLVLFVGVNWLAGGNAIQADGLSFYGRVFVLYWLTLIVLGCAQMLLLLLTRSRSQTLLTMVLFLLACWLLGTHYPSLLPWLPVAQTAILAQLLQNGTVHFSGSLFIISSVLLAVLFIGFVVFQRHEFAGFLKHQ